MHAVQQKWCERLKIKFPNFFKGKRVLDIGSLNVNGTNCYLFEDCDYTGLDLVPGKNVNVVSVAHEYECNELFDVVLSTNSLEHDMYYSLTLKKKVDLLKPGGLLFFSVANTWHEHGTVRTSPRNSGTSKMGGNWENYYKNLTPEDIKSVLNLDEIFSKYSLTIERKDLQFWGIKKQ